MMASREEVLAQQLAYFTECNLATLEELEDNKSTAKYRIERQKEICDKMITICKNFKVPVEHPSYPGHKLPRLNDVISEVSD